MFYFGLVFNHLIKRFLEAFYKMKTMGRGGRTKVFEPYQGFSNCSVGKYAEIKNSSPTFKIIITEAGRHCPELTLAVCITGENGLRWGNSMDYSQEENSGDVVGVKH